MDVAPAPDDSRSGSMSDAMPARKRRAGAFGLEELLAAPPERRAFNQVYKFWISLVAGVAYVALEVAIHMKCGISEEVLKKEGTTWPGCAFSPVGKGTIAFMEVICHSTAVPALHMSSACMS